jgi:hypothetical protein
MVDLVCRFISFEGNRAVFTMLIGRLLAKDKTSVFLLLIMLSKCFSHINYMNVHVL